MQQTSNKKTKNVCISFCTSHIAVMQIVMDPGPYFLDS